MATAEERRVFSEDILKPVGQSAQAGQRMAPNNLTGFLAMKGRRYKTGGLMVVGRAVNGWMNEAQPESLADRAFRSQFSRQVLEQANCQPMQWVIDCTRLTAFWSVIQKVMVGLDLVDEGDEDWPLHLVWSNLYKLSPAEGGNPGGRLQNALLCGCKKLLNLELRTYRPSKVLFLTGEDWAQPFMEEFQDAPGAQEYVQRNGILQVDDLNTQLVVAVHPQGRPQCRWVTEVIRCFNRGNHQ